MVLDVLAVVVGYGIVAATWVSAVATVVVPRGIPVRLTRCVFIAVRWLVALRRRVARSRSRRRARSRCMARATRGR